MFRLPVSTRESQMAICPMVTVCQNNERVTSVKGRQPGGRSSTPEFSLMNQY